MIPTFERPSNLRKEDQLYLDYFSAADSRIARTYEDRWQYHDLKAPYEGVVSRNEFLSIGTLNYFGRAPYEAEIRHAFAEETLRLRIDAGWRAYFANPERAKSLRKPHQAIRQMQNVSVNLSPHHESPSLNIGYDAFTDRSKVEYHWPNTFSFGVYHAHFTGALLNKEHEIDDISLELNFRTASLIGTSVHYAHSTRQLAVAYHSSLGSRWNAEFSFSQSTESPTERGAGITLTWPF